MNTSVVHPSGALLLEPVNQLILNVKMVNSKEVIPITFDTPQQKLRGVYRGHGLNSLLKLFVSEMLDCGSQTPVQYGKFVAMVTSNYIRVVCK